MPLLYIVILSAILLGIAYSVYGTVLSRLLRLDPVVPTPAVELRDDVDYVPIAPKFLFGQHFSAIAAAGPIVGPILAGAMFGWVPALIWILAGAIFIGGVHDTVALVASIRYKARSIAEVLREHMTQRSYILFLSFVWIAIVYIVVAFTDITASSFVGWVQMENGQRIAGGSIATSSMLYLALPIMMGLALRYTRLSLGWATVIFLPLVGFAIWIGPYIPFDLASLLGITDDHAHKVWNVALLLYCYVASVIPMWLLLQPRGHLGGYFLFAALFGGAMGLILGGGKVHYPAFTHWVTPRGEALFPILFITIACGACSGFHSIVASGTTSKQLRRETDAKVIGYGAMLLESLVAVVSLCCIMMLAKDSSLLTGPKGPQPNFIYAQGISRFLEVFGVPVAFGISFALMAFTTFVYDTLDVSTRLGRYIVQELIGWHDLKGKLIATALTVGVPLIFVTRTTMDASGNTVPAWRVYWSLFGASNQLLAALTLLGVTVWLVRSQKAKWAWIVTGLPMAWMYVMSVWALGSTIFTSLRKSGLTPDPVPWVGLILVILALLMLIEGIKVVFGDRSGHPEQLTQPLP